MVFESSSRFGKTGFALAGTRHRRTSFAFTLARPSHEMSAQADGGRDGISFRIRYSRPCQRSRARTVSSRYERHGERGLLLAGGIRKRIVRRKFQLARTDLDAGK